MKNLGLYYLAIILPIVLILGLVKYQVISSFQFTMALGIYVFVYRTFTDGYRLVLKKTISKKDIWKLLVPGTRFEYFKVLYLK